MTGILIAVIVSASWILLQNLLMHPWPAENRLRAMLLGYFFSLPFIYLSYRYFPHGSLGIHEGAPALELILAYFTHLLLFLAYAECFYYVERSVTIRLFVELLSHGNQGVPIEELQGRYSVDDMIRQRLELMHERGFLNRQDNAWSLKPKGLFIARLYRVTSWLFQFKGQHERT